jgi:hypothetical protein
MSSSVAMMGPLRCAPEADRVCTRCADSGMRTSRFPSIALANVVRRMTPLRTAVSALVFTRRLASAPGHAWTGRCTCEE